MRCVQAVHLDVQLRRTPLGYHCFANSPSLCVNILGSDVHLFGSPGDGIVIPWDSSLFATIDPSDPVRAPVVRHLIHCID